MTAGPPMDRLRGQRVLITRAAEDCGAWAARLRASGAVPVILPCIACVLIDEPGVRARLAGGVRGADWVVFTSRRGVDAFCRLLGDTAQSALPGAARVAVVGPATADAALARLGRVDLVAETATAGSLARALAARLQRAPQTGGAQILIAVAENADGVLQDILSAAGGACTRVDVYRTVPVAAPRAKRTLSALGADKILLASPSAVTGLLNQIELDTAAEIFSIGPSTSRAARAAELSVTAEAASPSLEGLLETMR